jgi:hypothetical protein
MNTKALLLSPANAALYLVTCALIGTGLLLELRMDEDDRAVRLLGMGQDDWGEIHLAIAIGFVALTVLHLLLNWAWIKAAVTRARWALPALAVGFGLVAALLLWPVDQKAAGRATNAAHHQKADD